MSRSPRKNLRTAAQALRAFREVCDRHPEAADEVQKALGTAKMAKLYAAIPVVETAADTLDSHSQLPTGGE